MAKPSIPNKTQDEQKAYLKQLEEENYRLRLENACLKRIEEGVLSVRSRAEKIQSLFKRCWLENKIKTIRNVHENYGYESGTSSQILQS